MKKKLCRLIFKKELNEAYNELNTDFKKEMLKIESAMKQNERRYGLVKKIFEIFPEAEIIGLDKNKKGEELIIVLDNNNAIYLLGERYQVRGELPKIYFSVIEKKSGILEEKYIHISDVLMEDNNIGNGTVAMKALLQYAKKNNVKYISGYRSANDDDHADRRDHYYEKFGFAVNDSNIYLDL